MSAETLRRAADRLREVIDPSRTPDWNVYEKTLLRPEVGAMLSDWLEATALQIERWALESGAGFRDGDLTEVDRAAIAVAQTILRGA